jgi:hypothetical protein
MGITSRATTTVTNLCEKGYGFRRVPAADILL